MCRQTYLFSPVMSASVWSASLLFNNSTLTFSNDSSLTRSYYPTMTSSYYLTLTPSNGSSLTSTYDPSMTPSDNSFSDATVASDCQELDHCLWWDHWLPPPMILPNPNPPPICPPPMCPPPFPSGIQLSAVV